MNLSDRVFTNADQEIVPYNGQLLQWRVSAYVIVLKQHQLLIIKNKNEKLYDIPGGGIELGETIQEAIEREAMEEAGAVVKINKLIHLQEGFFKHANGRYFQTIQLFHTASLMSELIEPTDDTTEFVGFVSLSELHNYPLPKPVLQAITQLKGDYAKRS